MKAWVVFLVAIVSSGSSVFADRSARSYPSGAYYATPRPVTGL